MQGLASGRIWICAALCALAGPVWALNAVEIVVTGEQPEDVRNRLRGALEQGSLSRRALDEKATSLQDIFAAASGDYRQAISVLYGEGFYGPVISVKADGREVADISPFEVPRAIDRIVITVDPGPQFRFGQTRVAPREPVAAARGEPLAPGFETGQPARSAIIGTAANAAVGEWREVGHAKAGVAGDDIIARHQDAALDVDVHLEPGPQLRFGQVRVVGETRVKIKRIHEMMGLPTGAITNPSDLNDAANRLRRSGAFRTVALQEADQPNPDGTLDYTLTVIDQLPRRFGFSGEYSTLDGAILSAFWLHRNLFGGAENLRFDAEISNIASDQADKNDPVNGMDYSLGFRLNRPAFFGADNVAFTYGKISHEDEPDYIEDKATVGIGLSRYFSDDLFGELAVGFRYSYVDDAFGEREFQHVVLPGKLEWDKRDDEGDPKRGFFFGASVVPAMGVLDSENLLYADLDNRGYLSFGARDNVTFAGRLQIGSVLGASLEGTPPEFLFFSGGGDTVRGHKYQSLGATTRGGDQVGGRSFVGLSTEIRTRITDAIGVVAFADYGIVGVKQYVEADSEEHSGVGLGLRYQTPIGPIRVDLATPYSGPDGQFNRVELYIGVGQAF